MRIISFLAILALSTSVLGKDLASLDEAHLLAESVMKEVSAGKMKEGIGKLRPYTIIPIAEFDGQVSQIDMQLPIIQQRFGNPIGYDYVTTEKLGSSLAQLVFIQKYERHLMVWRFIFYKPKDKWLLNTWYFNDQVKPLFSY